MVELLAGKVCKLLSMGFPRPEMESFSPTKVVFNPPTHQTSAQKNRNTKIVKKGSKIKIADSDYGNLAKHLNNSATTLETRVRKCLCRSCAS